MFVIGLERPHQEWGFFAKQWRANEFARAGLDPRITQINTVAHRGGEDTEGRALPQHAEVNASALYSG